MDEPPHTGYYHRLPGKGPRKTGLISGVGSRCRLYIGADHILAVDNHGFSEDYKRFYFSDIQAIVTRKTRHWAVGSAVIALCSMCYLGILLLPRNHQVGIFWWLLFGLFLIWPLVNLLKGPTCVCHIVTAVQEELLPSINRLRVADKVLPILESVIEHAQGRVSPEEMAAAPADGNTRYARSAESRPRGQTGGEGTKKRAAEYRGSAHLIAFSLLLAVGVLTAIDLGTRHLPSLMAFSMVLGAAYSTFLVIALIWQRGAATSGGMRSVTWACFAFVCVSLCLGYAITVYAMVHAMMPRPRIMANQWDISRVILHLSPHTSPFLMAVYGFEAVCSFVLGVLGLACVFSWRRTGAIRSVRGQVREGVY